MKKSAFTPQFAVVSLVSRFGLRKLRRELTAGPGSYRWPTCDRSGAGQRGHVRRRRLRRARRHRAVGPLQREPGPRLRPQRQRRLPHRRRLLQPRRGAQRPGAGGRGRTSRRQRRPPRLPRAVRRRELPPAPGRPGERAAARRRLARLRHAGDPGRRLVARRRFQLRRRVRLASVVAPGPGLRGPRHRRRRCRRMAGRARPAAARLRIDVPAWIRRRLRGRPQPRPPCRRTSRGSTSTRRLGLGRRPRTPTSAFSTTDGSAASRSTSRPSVRSSTSTARTSL